MKNNSKTYFLIIAAVIIWSLSGLLVKAVNVDPLWISLIRCLGGGIFLLPYIFKEKIYPIKNILFGGIIGLVIDPITGAVYKLTPKEVNAELHRGTAFKQSEKEIYIAVSLEVDKNWKKVGQLEKM